MTMAGESDYTALLGQLRLAGEERLARLLAQVMTSDRFLSAAQRVLTGSLELRAGVGRAVQAAAAQLQLPSTSDLARLAEEFERLDERLFRIERSLQTIASRLGHGAGQPEEEAPEKQAEHENDRVHQ